MRTQSKQQLNKIITDDVYPETLKNFKYWEYVKEAKPDLKLICFVVANYNNEQDISQSKEFKEWYEKHKDWVEIGVHGYDHQKRQEGWRSYEEQKECFKKAIEVLKPYLPDKFLVRFPGFRFLPFSENLIKELGASGVAHQEFIKYFETGYIIRPILNTHFSDEGENQISKIWKNLVS